MANASRFIKSVRNKRSSLLQPGLEFLACATCFLVAMLWYDGLLDLSPWVPPDSRWLIALACAMCFWWRLRVDSDAQDLDLIEPMIAGTGFVLMLEAFVGYTGLIKPLQLQPVLIGASLSLLLCGWMRHFWWKRIVHPPQTLLIGWGEVGMEMSRQGANLLVLDRDPARVPQGVPYLGGFQQLGSVLRAQQLACVIVEQQDWEQSVPIEPLLDFKVQGGMIQTGATAYERRFEKIHLPSFRMANVLRAETQRANRRVMALQAVYSNLIGLTLLLILSPALVILGILSRQAAGGGTLFDREECAGFQGIPFLRRRFKTRNVNTGQKTGIGAWIERRGLVNLPQIINLNRGEMGLFGPQPVRLAFSDYLGDTSPLHTHRLSIKPGIFGWEQLHKFADVLPEEHDRMAYDFYYVENGTPIMDIKILMRSLLGLRLQAV